MPRSATPAKPQRRTTRAIACPWTTFGHTSGHTQADANVCRSGVVQRDEYGYLVPFVEDEHTVFLKTFIPSRKAMKQYLGEEADDHED